jgi:hypothetical protein
MNEQDFERQLKADGFTEIEHQKLDPVPARVATGISSKSAGWCSRESSS